MRPASSPRQTQPPCPDRPTALTQMRRGAHVMKYRRTMSAIFSGVLCIASLAAVAHDDDDRDRDRDRGANATLIRARQRFFGIENVDEKGRVDRDKVIFSWATNTTYVVSAAGRVLLLDSYINRPELPTAPLDKRRTPILPQDFIDLRPEAIFLGHGHGDHADNAAYVAKWTGATIYASPETCDVMQQDVARMFNDSNLINDGAKIMPNGDPVNCAIRAPSPAVPPSPPSRRCSPPVRPSPRPTTRRSGCRGRSTRRRRGSAGAPESSRSSITSWCAERATISLSPSSIRRAP